MEQILNFLDNNLSNLYIPRPGIVDIFEIIIISVIIYHILIWMRNTRAWSLMKGIVSIMVMFVIAVILEMNTIIWIAQNVVYLGVIAVIVILQPELRKALETIGKQNFFSAFLPVDFSRDEEGLFSDHTIKEIAKACVEMSKVKTGALIVISQNDMLTEYEHTGIELDAVVSSQLLINIFEHNTPLHDGAVIVRGDRIVAATCYLPLSDNNKLSKELGTRHRAAVGMSEVSDALVICVSEETGRVSFALRGHLTRAVPQEQLREKLVQLQDVSDNAKKIVIKKGRRKDG